jgi:hypothetical protein
MGSYDHSPTTSGLPRRQVLLVEGLFASRERPLASLGTWFHLGWAEPHPVRER